MRNLTPDEWARLTERHDDLRPEFCGNGTCVDVSLGGPDQISFTSTKGADKGGVEYDLAEVGKFLGDVKNGAYDHLIVD
jgi:hypothetical protein